MIISNVQSINEHLNKTDSNLNKLHAFVDTTEKLTEKRLIDREKEITDLKEYVDKEKKISADERMKLEKDINENKKATLNQLKNQDREINSLTETISENTKMILQHVDDVYGRTAKKTDINFLEHQLSGKIIDGDKVMYDQLEAAKSGLVNYSNQLKSTESELKSVKDEVSVLKQALIYSAAAIGILAIVLPAIVFFKLKSKAKIHVVNQTNERVNDAYL